MDTDISRYMVSMLPCHVSDHGDHDAMIPHKYAYTSTLYTGLCNCEYVISTLVHLLEYNV